MGIRDTDKTLASNRLIFDVHRDRAILRDVTALGFYAVLAPDCVASHTAELPEATLKKPALPAA